MIPYLFLAKFVAVVHLLSVAAVVAGSLAAVAGRLRRFPRWQAAFHGLLALVILSDRLYGDCVLTAWEKELRNLAAPGSAYRNSFIGHTMPWLPHWIHADIGPALVVAALLAWPFRSWVDRRSLGSTARATR